MLASRRKDTVSSEGGAAMVIFAIVLPLCLAFGSFVITVGNWWVHKRHLQTQVDAAALAAGPSFVGCFLNPANAETQIAADALAYVGDTRRDPATTNLQVQQPNDVYSVLNSQNYWSQANGTDPNLPSPGYGLDYSVDPDGDPSTPDGRPCATKYLDVKATDDEAPTLWGWLDFVASPKTHAKVEIYKINALAGFLPWAVPENTPKTVAALWVDESDTNTVDSWTFLTGPADPNDTETLNGETVAVWSGPSAVRGTSGVTDETGLIILQSRRVLADSDLQGKSLSQICAMAASSCYGSVKNVGTTNDTGIGFIFGQMGNPGPLGAAINDADPSDGTPAAQLVLTPPAFITPGGTACTGDSAPYFIWTEHSPCDVRIQAQVAFGALVPLGFREVRVRLNSPFGNNCTGGYQLTRETAAGGGPTVWGSPWINIPDDSGRNEFYMCWKAGIGPLSVDGNFGGQVIQMAFAANTDQSVANTVYSGPIVYSAIQSPGSGCLGYANSLPKSMQTVCVKVGVQPPLRVSDGNAPPIFLRIAGSGSLNQALDCDAPPVQIEDEVRDGCTTPHKINERDLACSPNPTYDTNNLPLPLPPPDPDPLPDCIEANPGDVTSMAKGLRARFEDPPPAANCPPNLWDQYRANGEVPTPEDPRYVTLVISDYGTFNNQGIQVLPITKFAGFYATGWFEGGGAQGTSGCPDNDPPPTPPLCGGSPCDADDTKVQGGVWGYFITQVYPSPFGNPDDELCAFDELGTCIAVLVE